MIAALELHDLVALPVGARHAECEDRRLGPGRREAHLLGAPHRAAELVGQPQDGLVHEEVGGAALERVSHRGDHRRVRVAQDQRAGAHEVVDVLAPAHVVELGSRAAPDDEREIVREPRRPEDAAVERARRGFEHALLFVRSRAVHGVSSSRGDRAPSRSASLQASACLREADRVLEPPARGAYTGATPAPEGGMRELVFALEFRGSAGPVSGSEGRRRARTSATSQVLRTVFRSGDVRATVESAGDGVAILESEVQATGEGTFVESGTISYGDAGRVAFRTVGQGVTRPSAIAGLRHGAVIWEVTRGEGRLAGAQGFITSNFTVGPDGQVTDDHFVRLFVP